MKVAKRSKSEAGEIRAMFGSIARRYDLTNTVLSGGIHHFWKKAAIDAAAPRQGETALDLCCGTGDLALRLATTLGPNGRVIAVDFTPEMLTLAQEKISSSGNNARVQVIQGDALSLPFREASFDIATIAFGIRNVIDPLAALREVRRVLRPAGRLVILEFGEPANTIGGRLYKIYAERILPLIGGLLTGNESAYRYLPRTACAFATGEDFTTLLREAGFKSTSWQPLLWDIAHIYTASSVATTEDTVSQSKGVSEETFAGIRGASNA